jgi:hypothetical protein
MPKSCVADQVRCWSWASANWEPLDGTLDPLAIGWGLAHPFYACETDCLHHAELHIKCAAGAGRLPTGDKSVPKKCCATITPTCMPKRCVADQVRCWSWASANWDSRDNTLHPDIAAPPLQQPYMHAQAGTPSHMCTTDCLHPAAVQIKCAANC